ncbi:MAG: hypothetical protein MUP71_05115 [Candidatus Aminicenantes bacterium]|nr:hypothetical protein [Candidatus Aminicenantes bacterium]
MKTKIIFLAMIMLAGSRLAYAQYQIQFDSEADRVLFLGGETLRGNWCTRAEAEAYWNSQAQFEQNHSRIVGSECSKQNPPVDSSGSSADHSSQGQTQSTPITRGIKVEPKPFDNDDIGIRIKGGASANSFDGNNDPLIRLKDGSSAVGDGVAAVKAQLATTSPDAMFAKQEAPPEPRVKSIIRSLKIKAPPLPDMMFSQLQPGDVLLIGPESAVSAATYIWFYDQLSSWEWGSRASHTVLYLKEVKGMKYFLDNIPGEGPRIKTEDEIIDEYCTRPIDVARPLNKFDSDKLWIAARELGIKQITDDLKKLGDPELVRYLDIGTYYGLYGDDNKVCSEADRWALIQAGLEIADTESPIKKLLGIYFGPANYYSDKKNFLVLPLERLRKRTGMSKRES